MKPFGSGYFGEWVTDEHGLPAYRYDTNQLTDKAAVSPTNPLWRKENDHTFQFGNNRVTCVASNFGTVQVRQDEGGPKFLGDVDFGAYCYGGGLGFLVSDKTVLSTYYDGKADSFERVYGTGYMRKTVKKDDLGVNQLIFTPYGDDPVVISQVTLQNNSSKEKQVVWHEYWGSKPYPFSLRTLLLSLAGGGAEETYINNSAQAARRKFADRYKRNYSVSGKTLHNKMKFSGWRFLDKRIWGIVQKKYRPLAEKVQNYSLYIGELDGQEDVNPPETFLWVADGPLDTFITDAKAFFGKGGVENPQFESSTKMKDLHPAMIAVSPVTIPANSNITLTYIYGYLPEGFTFPELMKKYSKDLDKIFAASCEQWKNDRISLKIPGQDWIDREMQWHNQSLRGALSYDSAFGEHILSQGHVYQYIMGFQGASRDPLQHVMPFIFTDPGLVREILRYTFKSVLPDGTVPYGISGNGQIMISPFISDDLELWLLWTLSEYILATKDLSILNEKVVPYPYKGEPQREETIINLAKRVYAHFLSFTNTGANGLPRILGGDWNDNVVVGNTDPAERARIFKEGESVLVGAMAAAVLDKYVQVLDMAGEDSKEVTDFANKQREAVAKQWNGKWFKRAYLGGEIGWVDEETLWLEPQPWALMCGAADPEQTKTLVAEIKAKCQDPSPIGAMLCDKCPDRKMKAPKGMATNGGVWPSITGTLIMALGEIDPAAAYEEWRKNTLAYHTENYPKSWEGTWSGPDTYNSVLADEPGRTFFIADPEKRKEKLAWMDYPVYNLHPHAWPLYNAATMFLQSFSKDGVVFNLGLPEEEYEFDSPLAALKHNQQGFEGRYSPKISGKWNVKLDFFKPDKDFELYVNGTAATYEKLENGIAFTGQGGADTPLHWTVVLK